VTGYRNDLIKEYVGSGSKFGLKVDYCHNEKYYKTENIVSVKMAEEDLKDDGFVLINADDLFSPVILQRLIEAPGDIVLAVDGEGTVGTEEMKVSVNGDGRILAVSKQLDPEESFGEDIGVMKFSKEGGKAFFKAIDEIIQERGPHPFSDTFSLTSRIAV
jgi:choline kinase